jgi:hypothetical protein
VYLKWDGEGQGCPVFVVDGVRKEHGNSRGWCLWLDGVCMRPVSIQTGMTNCSKHAASLWSEVQASTSQVSYLDPLVVLFLQLCCPGPVTGRLLTTPTALQLVQLLAPPGGLEAGERLAKGCSRGWKGVFARRHQQQISVGAELCAGMLLAPPLS